MVSTTAPSKFPTLEIDPSNYKLTFFSSNGKRITQEQHFKQLTRATDKLISLIKPFVTPEEYARVKSAGC